MATIKKPYNNPIEHILTDEFCDGCCYNNNPRPEFRCRRIKCCYLVDYECIIGEKRKKKKEEIE